MKIMIQSVIHLRIFQMYRRTNISWERGKSGKEGVIFFQEKLYLFD